MKLFDRACGVLEITDERDRKTFAMFVWTMGILLSAMIALILISKWVGAWQEAKTYNRLTGAHTTTWDALWVELRVQDGAK